MWKKVKYQTAGTVYGDSKQAIGQTTGIEGRFNYTLNNAMDKANIAARKAAWDPKEWKTKYVNEKGEELEEEKVTDGYRHALAGYGTARAIRDKVPGWVPGGVASYIGKTGSKALGIGHELLNPNTQDINDVHFGSWLKNSVKEGLQDIHNNNVGANMITQMDEEQVKKKLLMDAYSGTLEPGIVWPEDNQRKDYDPNKPAKHQTGGDVDPEIQYQTGATVGVNANEIPSWLRKRFVGQSGPTIISEQKLIQNQKKYATEPIKNTDGILENIVEFFEPTGSFSHDDAKRAYSSWKDSERSYPNFSESMDMFGVVPALGKFGNIKYLKNAEAIKNSMKYVAPEFRSIPWQKIINSGDAIQDIEKDNIQKFQTAGTAGIDNTRVNVHKFREEDMKEVSPLANWAGARFRRPQGPTANSGELHQSPSLATRASHGITDAATNILGIPKSIFTGTLPSDEQKMANRSEANEAWGSRITQGVEAANYAMGDAMLGAGLGIAANKSAKVLSEAPTPMDAYREAMYRGITPGGYGVGKKLKEFVPNLVKNSIITPEERALGIMAEFKRPGTTANQLRESILREAYNPADAQRVLRNLQTKGEKRLDAFSLGVRGKQNFDTFEKIGKDTYRVKDSNLDPGSMVEIVNDFDSHVSMNQAGLYSGQHPLERLTQRAKEVSFRKNGVPSEFIPNEEYVEPWFPARLPKKDVKGNVVGVYDVDTYDMIRGGHSWDITPDVGDKTRTMTSFDEWNLHPLAGRGNTRVAEDKMRTIHPFKGMFKDVEFLKLMGGKPFKIQNKFDIDPKTFEIKKAYREGGVVTDPGKDFIEQASSNAGLGQFNIPRVKSKNELTNEKTRQSVMVEQPVSVSGMTNLLPEVKVVSKRDAVRADIENKVIMKKEAKALAFMDSDSIPGKDFVPEQRNYDAVPIMKHDSIKESTSVNFASPLSDSMIKKSIDVAEKPKVSVSDVPLIGNYEEVQKKRAIEPIKQFYKNYSEASKEEVVSLQKDLMSKGFELPKYGADGKFGDETKKAFEASLIEKEKQPAFLSEIKNELSKGSCESEHCATYVSKVLRLNVLGSAWEMKDNIERNRGRIKYNIYDDPRLKNANSPASLIKATKDVKSTSKAKPEMFEIGDVVGIAYYPSTHHQDALDGQRGGTKNTHVGTVTDIKNGVPIISHNISGKLHHDPYNKLTIGWIGSPNYKEVKPYENKFEKEVTDIDSAVDVYAKTMSKDFQVPVNPSVIKKDIEGILQVESGGGKEIPTQIDVLKSQSQRWLLGKNNSRADISRGSAKLKMNTFSQQERDFLGLNEETVDDPVMGVKAATYLYLKHFNTFQKYAKSNPHLKLTNEDIREMTILSHNQGTSKLLNLGYISDKKSFDEEIESLRKLNKGKVSDISSSKVQYFGPLKKPVYDLVYPGGHDSYTSRVLKHGEKKYVAPSK